jgi:hypothetical protein
VPVTPPFSTLTGGAMYYTYLWLREDSTPYYVGKGSKNRAYISFSHGVHKPTDKSRIIIYPAESETNAFETEIALIWYYGRKDLGLGCLRNLTDGGENPPKMYGKRSKETCRRISEALKGGVRTEEHRKKISDTLKAYTIPESVRIKMVTALRLKLVGKKHPISEENRKKISMSLTGKPGHKSTEETNQKIRLKATGRKHSAETRLKMSISAKNRGKNGRSTGST